MLEAAESLQFEKAAILRDQIEELKSGAPRSVEAASPKRQVKYDRKLKVNVVKKARKAHRLSS
jgi:excinuclease UvrABC nuclease subunit